MFPPAGINGQQIRRDASRFGDPGGDPFPLCRRKVPVLMLSGLDPWTSMIVVHAILCCKCVRERMYVRYGM